MSSDEHTRKSKNQIQNKYEATSAYSVRVLEIGLKILLIIKMRIRAHFRTIVVPIQEKSLSDLLW